jgi:hypothetical protein
MQERQELERLRAKRIHSVDYDFLHTHLAYRIGSLGNGYDSPNLRIHCIRAEPNGDSRREEVFQHWNNGLSATLDDELNKVNFDEILVYDGEVVPLGHGYLPTAHKGSLTFQIPLVLSENAIEGTAQARIYPGEDFYKYWRQTDKHMTPDNIQTFLFDIGFDILETKRLPAESSHHELHGFTYRFSDRDPIPRSSYNAHLKKMLGITRDHLELRKIMHLQE